MKATKKDLEKFNQEAEDEAKRRGYDCFSCWHLNGPDLEAYEWSVARKNLTYNLRDGWQKK